MARIHTAESTLRGNASLSFGAYARLHSQALDCLARPCRRNAVDIGRPAERL